MSAIEYIQFSCVYRRECKLFENYKLVFYVLGIYSFNQLVMAVPVTIAVLGMGTGKLFGEMFKARDVEKEIQKHNLLILFFIFFCSFPFLYPVTSLLPPRYSTSPFLPYPQAPPPPPSPPFPQALRPCHSSVVCLPPKTSRRRHDESRSLASQTAATVSC